MLLNNRMSILQEKEPSALKLENGSRRITKTMRIVNSLLQLWWASEETQRSSYDPRRSRKTELRKSPHLTVSAAVVVKRWVSPASRAASIREADEQHRDCPSLAGRSPQQFLQTGRASVGKVGDVLKLSFLVPSGKGGK